MRDEGREMRDERRVRSGRLLIPHLSSLILVASACATLGKLYFQEPQIQLQEINVTSLGLSGGTMDLVFDVYNPNDYRIRSTRIEVGVDLESMHFGDASLERPLDLSPTNHSRVVVPVRFEWAGVGAGARALLTKQAINFFFSSRRRHTRYIGDWSSDVCSSD